MRHFLEPEHSHAGLCSKDIKKHGKQPELAHLLTRSSPLRSMPPLAAPGRSKAMKAPLLAAASMCQRINARLILEDLAKLRWTCRGGVLWSGRLRASERVELHRLLESARRAGPGPLLSASKLKKRKERESSAELRARRSAAARRKA